MDEIFRALADPTRRAIIHELDDHNDQTLFELCTRLIAHWNLGGSRQAISKHIGVLIAAGLVTTHRAGRTTIHHLDTAGLGDAVHWLAEHTEHNTEPNKEKK